MGTLRTHWLLLTRRVENLQPNKVAFDSTLIPPAADIGRGAHIGRGYVCTLLLEEGGSVLTVAAAARPDIVWD